MFGLEWDRPVLYQSSRLEAYRAAAEALLAAGSAFHCRCSRSAIRAGNDGQSGRYPGTCRTRAIPPRDAAIRARVAPGSIVVHDGLQGVIETDLAASSGDYVIVRRDGLPAYHLAVVLDDAEQRVTTVVRGVDLLESTAAHVHLQGVLGAAQPRYFHVPVVVNEQRQKLSKQTGAQPIDAADPGVAARVLELLGLSVPAELARERPRVLWEWAVGRWRIESLRGQRELGQR